MPYKKNNSHSRTTGMQPAKVQYVPEVQKTTPKNNRVLTGSLLDAVKGAIDNSYTYEDQLDPNIDILIVAALLSDPRFDIKSNGALDYAGHDGPDKEGWDD